MEINDAGENKSPYVNSSDSVYTEICNDDNAILESNMCISCMGSRRSVAFVPCAHYVMCLSCGCGTAQCPICRTPVEACVRIYE